MAIQYYAKTGQTKYTGESLGEFKQRMQIKRIAERGYTEGEKKALSSSGYSKEQIAQFEAGAKEIKALPEQKQKEFVSLGAEKYNKKVQAEAQALADKQNLIGVYDLQKQQTRQATQYEQAYLEIAGQNQQPQSMAKNQPTITEYLKTAGKKNELIYFQTNEAGEQVPLAFVELPKQQTQQAKTYLEKEKTGGVEYEDYTAYEKRIANMLERESKITEFEESVFSKLKINKNNNDNWFISQAKGVARFPLGIPGGAVKIGQRISFAGESLFYKEGRALLTKNFRKVPGTVVQQYNPKNPDFTANVLSTGLFFKGVLKQAKVNYNIKQSNTIGATKSATVTTSTPTGAQSESIFKGVQQVGKTKYQIASTSKGVSLNTAKGTLSRIRTNTKIGRIYKTVNKKQIVSAYEYAKTLEKSKQVSSINVKTQAENPRALGSYDYATKEIEIYHPLNRPLSKAQQEFVIKHEIFHSKTPYKFYKLEDSLKIPYKYKPTEFFANTYAKLRGNYKIVVPIDKVKPLTNVKTTSIGLETANKNVFLTKGKAGKTNIRTVDVIKTKTTGESTTYAGAEFNAGKNINDLTLKNVYAGTSKNVYSKTRLTESGQVFDTTTLSKAGQINFGVKVKGLTQTTKPSTTQLKTLKNFKTTESAPTITQTISTTAPQSQALVNQNLIVQTVKQIYKQENPTKINPLPFTIQTREVKTEQVKANVTKANIITKPSTKTIQEPITKQIIQTEKKNIFLPKTSTRSTTGLRVATLTRQETIQEPRRQQVTIQTPRRVLVTPKPKQNVVVVPRIKAVFAGLKPQRQPTGFDVFVRKKGVFYKANVKPLEKSQALSFGAYRTSTTASATFQIRPSQTPGLGKFFGGGGFLNNFYSAKQSPNTYIQKRSKRIGTPGEKYEITYKGLYTKRTKARLF